MVARLRDGCGTSADGTERREITAEVVARIETELWADSSPHDIVRRSGASLYVVSLVWCHAKCPHLWDEI